MRKCDKLSRDISVNQVIIIFSQIGCELASIIQWFHSNKSDSFSLSARTMGHHLCIECGTSCSSVRALKKHQKDVHSQSKTTCSQCQKEFKNYKQMENHLSSHQTIVCIGCNLEIPKNSKSTHLCGENQPNFKCDQCDYVAKQKGALQRHLMLRTPSPHPT